MFSLIAKLLRPKTSSRGTCPDNFEECAYRNLLLLLLISMPKLTAWRVGGEKAYWSLTRWPSWQRRQRRPFRSGLFQPWTIYGDISPNKNASAHLESSWAFTVLDSDWWNQYWSPMLRISRISSIIVVHIMLRSVHDITNKKTIHHSYFDMWSKVHPARYDETDISFRNHLIGSHRIDR